MENLQNYINEENFSINQYEYDERSYLVDNIKQIINRKLGNKKFTFISNEIVQSKIIPFVNRNLNIMRALRYGIFNDPFLNLTKKTFSYDEIKNERIELGGYISLDDLSVNLKFHGEDGSIKDFELLSDHINFHTHPPYNGQWPFSPPSEVDIIYLLNSQKNSNDIIYNIVIAHEGVYIYYVHPELIDIIRNLEIDSWLDTEFQELKNLLGHKMSGGFSPPRIKRKKLSSPVKNQFISIDLFIETINELGICMILLPYNTAGGFKKFKITYTDI